MVLVTAQLQHLPLHSTVEMHVDSAGITHPDPDRILTDGRFSPVTQGQLVPGFSAHHYWLRLTLANPENVPRTVWLQTGSPRLQEVTLYQGKPGAWQQNVSGINHPMNRHTLDTADPVFPITLQAGEERQLLWHVSSQTAISMQPSLWAPEAYRRQESLNLLIRGLELGAAGVLSLYSLLQFFSIGLRGYALHGISILGFIVYELAMTGMGFRFLWPEAPGWATWSASIGINVSLAGFLLFFRDLCNTRTLMPRLDRALRLAVQGLAVMMLLAQCLDYRTGAQLGNMLCIVLTFTLPLIAGWAWLRVPDTGWAYPLASLLLGIGNLTRVLEAMGIMTSELWSRLGVPLASVACTVLMLTAFTQQVRRVRLQKDAANAALLAYRTQEQTRLEELVTVRTQALKIALETAQAANAAKTGLLAHISHDLRAPLATIISCVRQIGHPGMDAPTVHQAIENNARHQLELVDELIDYAQGELGDLPLQIQPGNWHAFTESIAHDARHLAQNNQFELASDPDLPSIVYADYRRLRRILLNLLSNAGKYTHNGHICLRIERRPPSSSGAHIKLRFSISDTGIGMSQATLDKLFTPFERGSNALTEEGTGLGLVIARSLTHALGGELDVVSTLQQGSCFSFTLGFSYDPHAHAHALTNPRAQVHLLLLAPTQGQAELHSLIAPIQSANHPITTVHHAADAISLLDQGRAAVLLIAPGLTQTAIQDALDAAHTRRTPIPTVFLGATPPPLAPGQYFDATLPLPISQARWQAMLASLLHQSPSGPTLEKPDAAHLQALRTFIANGQISDIESWATQLREHAPQHRAFADAVLQAVADLDLALLEQYCAQ